LFHFHLSKQLAVLVSSLDFKFDFSTHVQRQHITTPPCFSLIGLWE